jgi:hypothetical protein
MTLRLWKKTLLSYVSKNRLENVICLFTINILRVYLRLDKGVNVRFMIDSQMSWEKKNHFWYIIENCTNSNFKDCLVVNFSAGFTNEIILKPLAHSAFLSIQIINLSSSVDSVVRWDRFDSWYLYKHGWEDCDWALRIIWSELS